jgi:NO-binding membrane sensor protein with MHYT domain
MARFHAVIELALACAAVVGCAISWSAVRSTVTAGQPVTTSVAYDPPLLLLTLLLATAAGMLAVVGAARLRRASRRSAVANSLRLKRFQDANQASSPGSC